MKKKVNWVKIALLVLSIIELLVIIFIDKELVKANTTAWRIYCGCWVCIVINYVIISCWHK